MNENHVFAAIEQAQMALARYKEVTASIPKEVTASIPKEGHRALAVVATKLDEARLWLGEAVALIEEAQVGAAVARDETTR